MKIKLMIKFFVLIIGKATIGCLQLVNKIIQIFIQIFNNATFIAQIILILLDNSLFVDYLLGILIVLIQRIINLNVPNYMPKKKSFRVCKFVFVLIQLDLCQVI